MATTLLVAKNRSYSKLAAALTAGATELSVTAGEGANFPSTYPFHLTIEDEIVSCTNRSTDTLTIVRAQQGTSDVDHANKSYVALNITAKSVTDLNTAVNTIEATVSGGNLYLGSGGVIDFNSGDVTITHSTAIGGLLTYAGCHQRMDGAGQWQFRDALQYLRSDASGSFIVSAGTTLHLAIGGTNEIDITSTTMAMNGNTISECGDIHFNASAAMIDDAPTGLTIKGGNTTGDFLELQANSADASPKLKIIGNGRSEFTGNLAVFGTLNVGGLVTMDASLNLTNGDIQLANAKKIQFKDTNSFIAKGLSAHMEITTDGELVITTTNLYLNGAAVRIQGAYHLEFNGITAYIHSGGTGKIFHYAASTADDAIKFGTGAGGGVRFETFLRLHTTDGEGSVEGQIWYDNSENTIKVCTGSVDSVVLLTATQTLTNKTLTSPTINGTVATTGLTMPAFAMGGMIDVNGNALGDGTNELLAFTEVADAINHINITNADTGDRPILSVVGDDTNISMHITPKGTGHLNIDRVLPSTVAQELEGIQMVVDASAQAATSIFHALEIETTGTPAGEVVALATIGKVKPIHQRVSAPTTPDQSTPDAYAGRKTGGGATWGDGLDGIEIFVVDDDAIFVGSATRFDEIEVIMNPGATKDIKPTFWYSTGESTWAQFFPSDGTEGFEISGNVSWSVSEITATWTNDGIPNAGDTATGYWIKIVRTRATASDPGTPTPTTIKIGASTEYEWDESAIVTVAQVIVPIIYGYGSTYLRIGDANTTQHSLDSEDDLMVTGELEVIGQAFFGYDANGLNVKMFGDTASCYWLWNAANDRVDQVTTFAKATGNESAYVLTITDSSTASQDMHRGIVVDLTGSGAKTGSAHLEAFSADVTLTANTPQTAIYGAWVTQTGNPTLGYVIGMDIYFEDLGTNVGNLMGMQITVNGTNAAGSRHTPLRLTTVGAGNTKAGLLMDVLAVIGLDLNGSTLSTADIRFQGGTTLLDDGTDLTLAGGNLVLGAGLTLGGTVTLNGQDFDAGSGSAQINTTGGTQGLIIQSTQDGATGAQLKVVTISTSPAGGDSVARWETWGKDSNANDTRYGLIMNLIDDPTDGSEDSSWRFYGVVGSVFNEAMILSGAGALWVDAEVDTLLYKVSGTQVVGARVIDARCDDNINSGDGTTDGVIDALRDAMITHGLIAAA